jgi:uncharacterized membrane protein YebE (DUF533 family)
MSVYEKETLATIALLAAYSDKMITLEEKAKIESLLNILPEMTRLRVLRAVFNGETSLEEQVQSIDEENVGINLYGFAKEICEADGKITKKEEMFLRKLRNLIAFNYVKKRAQYIAA